MALLPVGHWIPYIKIPLFSDSLHMYTTPARVHYTTHMSCSSVFFVLCFFHGLTSSIYYSRTSKHRYNHLSLQQLETTLPVCLLYVVASWLTVRNKSSQWNLKLLLMKRNILYSNHLLQVLFVSLLIICVELSIFDTSSLSEST